MFTRRNFLKASASAGALMVLPKWSIGRETGPNDKLNVAVVGVGGRGAAAIDAFRNFDRVRFAAFCDVDDAMAAGAYNEFPDVPRFRDYRVMLDRLDKEIDAVTVATPDHMHYPISAWAIAKGKHVYCEKPLTRTIWEARELDRLAKEAGVITEMGNQGHAGESWRVLREWYEAGIIGEIEDIFFWTNRPIWPQGRLQVPPAQPVPATLDWPLWLGVAPFQPYNEAIAPFNWRGLRNYGTGAAGDMGCHFMDTPCSAFDLGFPKTVRSNSTPFNDYSWPADSDTSMVFENARGVGGKIGMHWYDGGRRPKSVKRVTQDLIDPDPYDPWNRANCIYVVGTKETVQCGDGGNFCMIHPRDRMVEMTKNDAFPKPSVPRSVSPYHTHMEWALCCLEGKQPPGNFSYAAPLTEVALLSIVSLLDPDKDLEYNPESLSFSNSEICTRAVKSFYDYNKEYLP